MLRWCDVGLWLDHTFRIEEKYIININIDIEPSNQTGPCVFCRNPTNHRRPIQLLHKTFSSVICIDLPYIPAWLSPQTSSYSALSGSMSHTGLIPYCAPLTPSNPPSPTPLAS